MQQTVRHMTDNWHLFDLLEQGKVGLSSGYLYTGPKKVLVDTGSALCHEHIVQALNELGLALTDLDYVILTHLHLDHAGGAGVLAKHAPQAQFLCQKRAARHLIDPTRLIVGAGTVYGDDVERLFGEILPVPEKRVRVMADGEKLDIGDRVLQFYDTPGHAKHHLSVWDAQSRLVFTGDTIGIRYVKEYTNWDFELVFPSTSPTDFDPEAVHYSVTKIKELDPHMVCHTHFGPSLASDAFAATLFGVDALATLIKRVYRPDIAWTEVADEIRLHLQAHIRTLGHNIETLDAGPLDLDIELNAKGLLHYEQKRQTNP